MNIQTFLVIGSLVAITYTILNLNSKIGTETTWQLNNEAVFSAVGLAESLLEEIELKAFDEKTISKRKTSTDSLTLSSSLGKDSGESNQVTFDDMDDYNGYVKKDTLDRLGVFTTNINVYYTTTMSPETKSTNRTFSKRLDITIINQYMLDTLFFSKIAAY